MGTFIVIVIVGTLAAAVIGGIAAAKASTNARNQIVASPKFKEITDYIFNGGRRPSRIVITFNNEIFFGPIEGKFVQVPGTMIPSMNDSQRQGLGGAFETKYAYRYHRCNTGQRVGGAPADTGNEYIDTHAYVLLISSADSSSNW